MDTGLRQPIEISDAQIAAEIGDASGASIIASTYGAVPPNWKGSTQKLTWTPTKGAPAWEVLKLGKAPKNIVRLGGATGL